MADKFSAAKEIERQAKHWQNMLAVAEELRKVGSLEDQERELQERLAALRDALGATEAAVMEAGKALNAAEQAKSQAADDAVAILNQAREDAQALHEQAKSAIAAERAAIKGELERTTQEVKAAKTARDAMLGEAKAAEAKKNAIEAELAAIRKKVA